MIEEVYLPKKVLEKLKEEDLQKLFKNTEVKIEKSKNSIKIFGEPCNLFRIKRVIYALSRNFELKDAINLLNDDYVIEEISIRDFTRSRNRIKELKGRVIGEKGRAKKRIEELTNTKITICGKTVIILGKHDDVFLAKRAVEMLLEGRKHTTVFSILEKSIASRDIINRTSF